MEYENNMTVRTNSKEDAVIAKNAIIEILKKNANQIEEGYSSNPAARFVEAMSCKGNEVVLEEDGYFIPEEIGDVLETIMVAVANALSGKSFTCEAETSSTYASFDFNAAFNGSTLSLDETYWPEGRTDVIFCPECDAEISIDEIGSEEVWTCPECGEEIDLSSQLPERKTLEITIK